MPIDRITLVTCSGIIIAQPGFDKTRDSRKKKKKPADHEIRKRPVIVGRNPMTGGRAMRGCGASALKMQKGKRSVKGRQVVRFKRAQWLNSGPPKIRRLNLPFKCDLNPLRQTGNRLSRYLVAHLAPKFLIALFLPSWLWSASCTRVRQRICDAYRHFWPIRVAT